MNFNRRGRGFRQTNQRHESSANDSARGTLNSSERPSTSPRNHRTTNSSSVFRDSPWNDSIFNDDQDNHRSERPISIPRNSVQANQCLDQAFVSHVDHPSAFFLQLAHSEEKFAELERNIDDFYSTNPMTKSEWKRGEYCIAKYKNDKFFRARIIATPEVTKVDGFYDVAYLDFGNYEKVATNDIHILLPEFATLAAQAIPCSLAKTLPPDQTWFDCPQAIEKFKELVLDKYVDATFYPKTSRDYWHLCFVDLVLSSTKLNILEELKKTVPSIRQVPNEEIYFAFNSFLTPIDCLLYSIPCEDDDN